MYKAKDRKTPYLFEELFPFGGKLDENNRWLRIAELIPWDELESSYRSYFSHTGRPAKDGRLVIGLLLLKHMTNVSDEEMVQLLRENIYFQAFCGFEHFVTNRVLDSSTLSKARGRLGVEYFRQLEEKTYSVLIERKIIRGKGLLVDATVFGQNIKYPTDVGLLNDVRQWLVGQVKTLGKRVDKNYRRYCRKAKAVYLGFSKKRRKTRKVVREATRKMIQYVRRNLAQMKEAVGLLASTGEQIKQAVAKKLAVAEKIYQQQLFMYKNKTHRVAERIVSFHREYVRPIKRGKAGKKVEFGPKAAVSHVDGFLFLDRISHDNFSEADTPIVEEQIASYEKRFGKKPPSLTADNLYGTRANRQLVQEQQIRGAFKPLGRRPKAAHPPDRWFKAKQRERNRIEGHLGHGKQHFRLDRILYDGEDGSELWVRAGILGMNLKRALARM